VIPSISPIERAADRILVEHPSREYPSYTSARLAAISKREILLDPKDLSIARDIIPKEQQCDKYAYNHRQKERAKAAARRARKAEAISRQPTVDGGEPEPRCAGLVRTDAVVQTAVTVEYV